MQDVLPTVVIETENGPVIINKSDFDESKHKLASAKIADKIPSGDPVNAPGPNEVFPAGATVVKTGKKFFVVDSASDNAAVAYPGIEAAGYDSDADAWKAIMTAKGGAAQA